MALPTRSPATNAPKANNEKIDELINAINSAATTISQHLSPHSIELDYDHLKNKFNQFEKQLLEEEQATKITDAKKFASLSMTLTDELQQKQEAIFRRLKIITAQTDALISSLTQLKHHSEVALDASAHKLGTVFAKPLASPKFLYNMACGEFDEVKLPTLVIMRNPKTQSSVSQINQILKHAKNIQSSLPATTADLDKRPRQLRIAALRIADLKREHPGLKKRFEDNNYYARWLLVGGLTLLGLGVSSLATGGIAAGVVFGCMWFYAAYYFHQLYKLQKMQAECFAAGDITSRGMQDRLIQQDKALRIAATPKISAGFFNWLGGEPIESKQSRKKIMQRGILVQSQHPDVMETLDIQPLPSTAEEERGVMLGKSSYGKDYSQLSIFRNKTTFALRFEDGSPVPDSDQDFDLATATRLGQLKSGG